MKKSHTVFVDRNLHWLNFWPAQKGLMNFCGKSRSHRKRSVGRLWTINVSSANHFKRSQIIFQHFYFLENCLMLHTWWWFGTEIIFCLESARGVHLRIHNLLWTPCCWSIRAKKEKNELWTLNSLTHLIHHTHSSLVHTYSLHKCVLRASQTKN